MSNKRVSEGLAADRQFRGLAFIVLCLACGATNSLRAQCHFAKTDPAQTITYRFETERSAETLVLHMTVEFQMNEDATETVELPGHWAGETLHSMTNLHAISKKTDLTDGSDVSTKTVHAPKHHRVILGYDLRKDWQGPLVHPLQFHPVLLPEYFEVTGSNAFVAPRLDQTAIRTVNFDWQKLPADWAVATSFGTTTALTGRCQTHTGPWIDIDDGLYAAGDFRIHDFEIGQRPAVLAIRGNWLFTDDEAMAQIGKVIENVRNFWHDDNFPYFLVTVKPYDRDHGSSDGSAFTNAFWMYMSRLDPLKVVLPQLAHESFHAWDPMRMGIVSAQNEDSIKWFREGPSDYYGELLTLKTGELSPSDCIHFFNKDLGKFPASDSEYIRGDVISLWLDATIRRESGGLHSLDDVMYDMVRDANQPLTLERIFATAGHYLSADSMTKLRSAVNAHGDLPAPDPLPAVDFCAHPTLEDLPTFDLGLDFPHSRASRKVTGVVPGGPAYNAGLRDGQVLHGHLSVDNGNPDRLAIFTVATPDGDKAITFYPRGKPVSAWQYHIDQIASCQLKP